MKFGMWNKTGLWALWLSLGGFGFGAGDLRWLWGIYGFDTITTVLMVEGGVCMGGGLGDVLGVYLGGGKREMSWCGVVWYDGPRR